jgi:heterodisulfide reductase subunit A
MNAVKDAMLIRQHDPAVETVSILHTDLRAFGRGYDDFVERARAQGAATWIRGRASRIVPAADGALAIQVEDATAGAIQVEADLVVLSMAAAPNDGAAELAGILGLSLDREGFLAREDPAVSCVETGREGIYVCGSAVGPQVIPDCVAQGSAAAARAERFLAGARLPEAPSTVIPRDASGPPRVGVLVCHCGVNIGGVLDIEALVERARGLPGVVVAEPSLFACSATGQEDLARLVDEHGLNRVVVAACTPRTHEPVFRETLARVGMNPFLLEMVNIRDQCSWVHAHQPEAAQQKAHDLLRMGIARARHLEPLSAGRAPVTRAALVIGGGIAGIQAATDLAEQGFPVVLVERSEQLGGRLSDLRHLYPNLRDAPAVLAAKIARLRESGARVLMGTEVSAITGFVGSFSATLTGASREPLAVGAIVLAFGADLFDPKGVCGYGRLGGVITSARLERDLAASAPLPKSAAFLLCVGSREPGVAGCSRYCCPTAVKQALELARAGVDTTVLYRDLRLVSSGAEAMAREARRAGVLFVHVQAGTEPEPLGKEEIEAVRVHDDLSGRVVEIPAERLVLATGMRPRRAETAFFHDVLKASVALDGFFLERHPELAPVETAVEGVFLAGTVQGPKDVVDTVAQASAAAAKAAVILAADGVRLDPAVATVDEVRCRACGKCVEICRYTAPSLVVGSDGWKVARVNASLCKGCGTCAAWCPSGAITARHFTDRQVLAMVDALFAEPALEEGAP